MANETALTVISDDTGYAYDLLKLPDQNAPLIKEAGKEILQDMQVDNIIQNLENVARLMFIAYNALGGTMVQSKMSALQKKYLDLMDESGQAITTFRRKSQEICVNVAKAYDWLLKGKESMAVVQFNKCSAAAAEMAERAEKLADGFMELSNQAETVLEKTQDEQALQYKKMDELKAQMESYNASMKKCESLQKSLNSDIESINKVYNDARKKEQEAFNMKKGLMITQIVTSCIGAIIPSVTSMKSGGGTDNSKAAQEAQSSLSANEKQKEQLLAEQAEKQKKVYEAKAAFASKEKEIADIRQKIEIEESVTARSEEEKRANLAQYNNELQGKIKEKETLEAQLREAESSLKSTDTKLTGVTGAIDKLNQQLSAFADSCRDDLQRAEEAAERALEKKLELEKQRRETLASIQEFTALIQASVRQENVAETAVQTLQVAIRCIKQVVVALSTAAKFWRSMEEYCKSLSDSGLGNEIKELSIGLDPEERLAYYHERDFMLTFLVYICRWAALYYVCDDYKKRSDKVRGMVTDNIQSSYSREEEWKLAGELASDMSGSIREQVENSKKITEALGRA